MIVQKHCPDCGALLIEKELEHEGIVPFCPECQQFRFPFFNTACSMIVVNESNGKIVLIQQYNRAKYILVAGYVMRGENLENTVRREVQEELGMTVTHVQFNRSKFFERSNTLMCNFTAFVKDDSELQANYEIDKYTWFTPDEARENIFHGSLAEEFLLAYLDGAQL